MVKRSIKVLFGLVVTFSAGFALAKDADDSVFQIKEGVHYTVLKKVPTPDKEVMEIFSFNCPACAYYETKLDITKQIKEVIPQDARLVRYHLSSFGTNGESLTTAWAMVNILGIEDAAAKEIFDLVYTKKMPGTEVNLRKIIESQGITPEQYNSVKGDAITQTFITRNNAVTDDYNVRQLPTFIVNGIYSINLSSLETTDEQLYNERFKKLIKYLLNLKK